MCRRRVAAGGWRRSAPTATCGQVTAADFISHARCEFAVFAGGRKYAMRADTKFELDMWLEVCNRHGRMWLTDLSV